MRGISRVCRQWRLSDEGYVKAVKTVKVELGTIEVVHSCIKIL